MTVVCSKGDPIRWSGCGHLWDTAEYINRQGEGEGYNPWSIEGSVELQGKQRLLFGGKGKHDKLMGHSITHSFLPENVTTGDANTRPGRGSMVSSAIVTHAATGVTAKLKGTSSKRQRNKAVQPTCHGADDATGSLSAGQGDMAAAMVSTKGSTRGQTAGGTETELTAAGLLSEERGDMVAAMVFARGSSQSQATSSTETERMEAKLLSEKGGDAELSAAGYGADGQGPANTGQVVAAAREQARSDPCDSTKVANGTPGGTGVGEAKGDPVVTPSLKARRRHVRKENKKKRLARPWYQAMSHLYRPE